MAGVIIFLLITVVVCIVRLARGKFDPYGSDRANCMLALVSSVALLGYILSNAIK